IALTDENTREASRYFFSRPTDTLRAVWDAIWGAHTALLRGAIYYTREDSYETAIRPHTKTLKFSAPLILAGLGVGFGFRAGMFNIGGRGQMLLGGAAAGWIGVKLDLPAGLHLLLALLVAMTVGGIWAGIAGYLKARTGAHEVIVT